MRQGGTELVSLWPARWGTPRGAAYWTGSRPCKTPPPVLVWLVVGGEEGLGRHQGQCWRRLVPLMCANWEKARSASKTALLSLTVCHCEGRVLQKALAQLVFSVPCFHCKEPQMLLLETVMKNVAKIPWVSAGAPVPPLFSRISLGAP